MERCNEYFLGNPPNFKFFKCKRMKEQKRKCHAEKKEFFNVLRVKIKI